MTNAIIALALLGLAAWALTLPGGWIALVSVAALLYLAYKRLSLLAFTATVVALLVAYTVLGKPPVAWAAVLWTGAALLALFNIRPLRKAWVTRPFLKVYRRMLPSMSDTEREALEAGTVWWDGELFTGKPDWSKLLGAKAPQLTAEEQAFLDGPCEELCGMIDDFDITHRRGDMPPEVWDFLKRKGFFSMIIQKKYGGLEFSAYAHSCVLAKLSTRSATVSSTVAVPLLDDHREEALALEELPDLGRHVAAPVRDVEVIDHPAEFLAGTIEEGLFLSGQLRGLGAEQLRPVRFAGEQFAVPPDGTRFERFAFGRGHGRQHAPVYFHERPREQSLPQRHHVQ